MTNPSPFATGGGPILAIIGAVLEIVGTHLDRPVGLTPEQVEAMLHDKAQQGRDDIAAWFRTHDQPTVLGIDWASPEPADPPANPPTQAGGPVGG